MVEHLLYETLDTLADKYIPSGIHKMLHVNSREAWVDLMVDLIENKSMPAKLSMLSKCAINWELLLIQKISIQN